MIISPSIYLFNKSYGLVNGICNKRNKFLSYSSNRIVSDKSNAILPILLWYPQNILIKAIYHALALIKGLCTANNTNIVYAVLSVDINISYIFKNISYISIQNCSTFNLCYYFLALDYTYKLYNIGEDNKCSLIYGCIKQNLFPKGFVNKAILTPYNESIFSGRYAAAVNLYPALPFMLKLFDYFDYIIKYDIDNKVSNTSLDIHSSSVILNSYELIGCNIVNDNVIVSTNIFKMIFMYLSNLTGRCKESLFGKGFSQNFIQNENVVLHGRLTIAWLGLYNSPEVYDFLKYYLSYKEGIYKYRWGDQQFYLNALLLFSSINKLGYTESNLCKMHDIKMFL